MIEIYEADNKDEAISAASAMTKRDFAILSVTPIFVPDPVAGYGKIVYIVVGQAFLNAF